MLPSPSDHQRPVSLARKYRQLPAIWTAFWLAAFMLPAAASAAVSTDEAFQQPEEASCQLTLRVGASLNYRGARSRGYEVFSPLRHQEAFPVVIEHTGPACSYALDIASVGRSVPAFLEGPGSGQLVYEVREGPAGNSLLRGDLPGIDGNGLSGQFADGPSAQNFLLFMEIEPGRIVPAGQYSDILVFRLYQQDGITQVLADERSVWVSVDVPAAIQAGIGGIEDRTMQTSVDLGQLYSGLRRSLAFSMQANVNVTISFVSANEGRLVHDQSAAFVPYSVQFDGESFVPDGNGSHLLHGAATSRERYSFDILVGEIPRGGLAGRYSDVLTITITSA